ncbi:3-carboxy-cis,cis-muconate cycloisomerase [Kitasatospora sp. NPDC088346]|uniref:3-carboxy-cis,cis-muconate cycloisomerase n=1 Tax=Kitasatospora sp. NPDC088346 TaxID=3364073 RepID=UPI0038266593
MNSTDRSADCGLLSPTWAGSPAEQATDDTAYLRAMLDAEAALTRAQAALGLAPRPAAHTVTTAAADTAHYDTRDLALRSRRDGNPVIPLVADLTAAVAAHDPAAAPYVHRGATTQDILDTATMLVASRTLQTTLADLDRTAKAVAHLAAEHRDTLMPGRTLTQHAVPTTFGLKAAGWLRLVLDARTRLDTARNTLPAQLGGAAGTLAAFHAFAEPAGTPVPADLGLRLIAAYATETGLAEPALPWHTLRTPIADLGGALAFTTAALGKIAADVLLLSRTETGEVAEASRGGSSAMPHKTNPVRATLIAAAARQTPALAGVLYGCLVAEDERPAGAWHAEWQTLRQALRLAGGAANDAASLTEGLRVHPYRMLENLDATDGLILTEHVAAALTALIGRAEARAASEAASRHVLEDGLDLSTALQDTALHGVVSPARLRELTDPTTYLGSARALVDRTLRGFADPGSPR